MLKGEGWRVILDEIRLKSITFASAFRVIAGRR